MPQGIAEEIVELERKVSHLKNNARKLTNLMRFFGNGRYTWSEPGNPLGSGVHHYNMTGITKQGLEVSILYIAGEDTIEIEDKSNRQTGVRYDAYGIAHIKLEDIKKYFERF